LEGTIFLPQCMDGGLTLVDIETLGVRSLDIISPPSP